MDEKRLAAFQPPAREHVVVNGEIVFRNAAGFLHAERLWPRQAKRRIGERIFGIATRSDESAGLIADLKVLDAISDSNDTPGNLQPRDLAFARRRRIGAGALRDVGAV